MSSCSSLQHFRNSRYTCFAVTRGIYATFRCFPSLGIKVKYDITLDSHIEALRHPVHHCNPSGTGVARALYVVLAVYVLLLGVSSPSASKLRMTYIKGSQVEVLCHRVHHCITSCVLIFKACKNATNILTQKLPSSVVLKNKSLGYTKENYSTVQRCQPRTQPIAFIGFLLDSESFHLTQEGCQWKTHGYSNTTCPCMLIGGAR